MVSVVMPAYNEEQALPHTLESLLRQEGLYEVILVDGGSTDRTRGIAKTFEFVDQPLHGPPSRPTQDPVLPNTPARRMLNAPKGRASQMNAGAKAASGEWLLFLHADTLLPQGAIRRLNGMVSDQSIRAGGFMHRFSGHDRRLTLISFLDNVRCRFSRIIYGDQALFVRRALFEELGGFPNQPFLEDVAFCERLNQVTTPLLLTPPVITDARKFITMGIWRSFARVILIILHIEFGFPTLPRAFFKDIR